MNDPHSDFQLHSIEKLRRSRRRESDPGSGTPGEPRSWARDGDRHVPSPYIPAAGPEHRLSYDVLTSDAKRVAVTLSCEPILDLRRGERVSSYLREQRRPLGRVEASGSVRGLPHLRRDDRELLDGLRFKRGLALLEAQGPGYGVMQTSWREATQSRPAFIVMNQCLRARVDPHVRVIGELVDLPAGAGRAELAEVVAFLAERRRGVIARLPPDAEALDAVMNIGLRGVSYSLAPPVLASFAMQWTRLEALLKATRKIFPYVLVDEAKPELGDKLREAGATHAVFTRFGGRLI